MDYDVIVIGSGPGGYVAAIRAAQLGFKTACIEKYPTRGGTCLNVGCIPSKALLQSSELFHEANHGFSSHGIQSDGIKLNLNAMLERKNQVVKGLTQGVSGLLKKNKVDDLQGSAKLLGEQKVEIHQDGEKKVVTGKHIILATGSKPIELPFLKFKDQTVVSSTGALEFEKVPEHLIVVGGGVIGLELGSVWLRLGSKVTVVEFLDRLLPPMDRAVSREMKKVLTRQGMKFHLNTKVTQAEVKQGTVILKAEDKSGKTLSLEGDKVLVAVGRKPYTDGLNLEQAGVATDKHGFVEVDSGFQTQAKGIYAIGDVIGGLMLAHKAEEEGIALVEALAGKASHINYDATPNIVYTWPEVASTGKTEEELKESGTPYKEGKFPFKANARARCAGQSDGFVKILAHAETDRLLGVHIVGPHASELIGEAVLAMEYMASAEDLARTIHGHPTLTEAVKEAALAVDGRAIHF